MRLQQAYDDSRRFHAERRELYGKLLEQAQTCRDVADRNHEHENSPLSTDSDEAIRPIVGGAFGALSQVGKEVQLIAVVPTQKAAEALVTMAALLVVYSGKSSEKFHGQYKKLLEAETAFLEAARAELLPTAPGPPQPGRSAPKLAARWCHWAALVCEVGGTSFVYLEAQRTLAQLHAAGFVSDGGGPPAGYTSWIYASGRLGFVLLLAAIVLTGIALTLDSSRPDRLWPGRKPLEGSPRVS